MQSEPTPKAIYLFLKGDHPMGAGVRTGAMDFAREHHLNHAVVPASRHALAKGLENDCIGAVAALSDAELAVAKKLKIPFINVGNSHGELKGVGNFLSDDLAVGELAAQHLKDMGYERFLCFQPGTSAIVHKERARGFHKCFPGNTCPPPIALDLSSRQHQDWTVLRYLGEMAERFEPYLSDLQPNTGIFCTNDWLAGILMGVMRMRTPELLHTTGILGVDNLNENIWYGKEQPGLSSVMPGFTRMGYEAVKWLEEHPGEKGLKSIAKAQKRFPPAGVVTRSSTVGGGCADPLTARMIRWVWNRVQNSQSISVESMAHHFHVSRKTVYRNFIQYTGRSPVEAIELQKLMMAKELLRNSPLSIGEISQRCGFAKQDVLSRLMRRVVGCTPREYRKAG